MIQLQDILLQKKFLMSKPRHKKVNSCLPLYCKGNAKEVKESGKRKDFYLYTFLYYLNFYQEPVLFVIFKKLPFKLLFYLLVLLVC